MEFICRVGSYLGHLEESTLCTLAWMGLASSTYIAFLYCVPIAESEPLLRAQEALLGLVQILLLYSSNLNLGLHYFVFPLPREAGSFFAAARFGLYLLKNQNEMCLT